MVFSSVIFLLYFLPVVLILYMIPSVRVRNGVLLLASMVFYAWGEPWFILIMLVSIFLNYLGGMLLACTDRIILRKLILWAAVFFNIGILFYFKYINFFIDILNRGAGRFISSLQIQAVNVSLPIGLSFFTFQGLSYVIDVYRRDVPTQRNPLYVALYSSMFPQLIAGPIVRYSDIAGRLSERSIKLDDIYQGMCRFIIGLGKKVMIADLLAVTADRVFGAPPGQITAGMAWIGALCYTLQIYFDFMGYSDMAIGLGRILGFHFCENFNLPYISQSITEFRRRWHISLSSWFRDYVYIPLGGNRKGNVYVHLLIVFLLTGLWHGADYTFVLWGLWHGFFILAERYGKKHAVRLPFPKPVKWLYTMFIVLMGWVLFRSDNAAAAIAFFRNMFGLGTADDFIRYGFFYYIDRHLYAVLAAAVIISFGIPKMVMKRLRVCMPHTLLQLCKELFLLAVLYVSIAMIVNGNFSPFIYFRF